MEAQCAITWEKVANCVLEILAQHIPEGQVGVFLAALYQFMCNKKSPPWWSLKLVSQYTLGSTVGHTGIYDPVILGLASLSGLSPVTTPIDTQMSQPEAPTEQVQYTAIPLEGSTIVSTRLFPGKQVRCNGMAVQPIYLGNDTDSIISSICHSTPVKTLGGKRQPLASTPKTNPKLLVTAQQHRNELVAMRQGAQHGAHVWPL